jgi:hypothetical protein
VANVGSQKTELSAAVSSGGGGGGSGSGGGGSGSGGGGSGSILCCHARSSNNNVIRMCITVYVRIYSRGVW